MTLFKSGTKEETGKPVMEEKPKRKSRAAKTPGEAAPRKVRPPKTPTALPLSGEVALNVGVEAVAPALDAIKPKTAAERMDATVPLSFPQNGTTNPFANGSSTDLGEVKSVPRRIICQQVEASYLSDVGKLRTNNEDSAGAFLGTVPRPDGNQELFFGFLAVADGMGGHERGEVASNLAVRKMTEGVLKYFYLPTVEGRPPGRDGETPIDVLTGLVEDANQAILQEAHQSHVSMGTTLTCAILVGQTAFIGHVGDSRLYVLENNGNLRQITHDHSMVQRLVDMGQLSAEDAANSPQRSILYLSLGQKGRIEADVEVISLVDVKYMLLCSDGLWDMIEDQVIEQILRDAPGPAEASANLVEAANRAGGADNITVVIAKF